MLHRGDLIERPVPNVGTPDHQLFREHAPHPRIERVLTVVTQDEQHVLGHGLFGEIAGPTLVQIRLIQRDPVQDDHPVLNGDCLALAGDDSLDEIACEVARIGEDDDVPVRLPGMTDQAYIELLKSEVRAVKKTARKAAAMLLQGGGDRDGDDDGEAPTHNL